MIANFLGLQKKKEDLRMFQIRGITGRNMNGQWSFSLPFDNRIEEGFCEDQESITGQTELVLSLFVSKVF